MMLAVKSSSWWSTNKQIVAWCYLLGPPCYAMLSSSDQWAGAVDSGGGWNRDAGMGLVAGGLMASPDCWLDSLRTLNVEVTATADACGWMTSTYQKIMALELARCHVHDLGRTLFDESTELYNSDKCANVRYRENLGECLVHLTPSAETAYTHFLTYINQLCTRLSREVVMNQFYDISINLAKVASDAKEQLQETLQQQENAWLTWKQREGSIVEFHDRLQEQFHQEQDRWTREGLLALGQWQQDQEEWLRRQKDSQQGHLNLMVEQQEELRRQREELTRLSDALAQTHQSIQPWSLTLEDLYQYAKIASCFLRMALHFAGCVVTCWFLTFPRCLLWLRRLLLLVIVAGAVVEALAFWSLQSKSKLLHLEGTWEELSTTIRCTFGFCEGVLYIFGCLLSPCSRGGRRMRDDVNHHGLSPNNEPSEYHRCRIKHERCRNKSILPCPRNDVSHHQRTVEPNHASIVSPSPPVPMPFVRPLCSRQDLGASLDREIDTQQKRASSSRDNQSDQGGKVLHHYSSSSDQVGWQQPTTKESGSTVIEVHKKNSSDTSSGGSSISSDDRSITSRDTHLGRTMIAGSKRKIDSRDTDFEVAVESRKRPKYFEESKYQMKGVSMQVE